MSNRFPTPAAGARLAAAWALAFGLVATSAQAASPAARKPAAATKPPVTAPAQAAAATAERSGKGWKTGPLPAWVVAPPAATPGLPAAPQTGGRREQLVDLQVNHALPRPQTFVRIRSVALDAAALGSVSQPTMSFNPAYQTLTLHSAAVLRDGQRTERLAEARIEPMRREQRLEQQVIDGNDSLLVVLNDVRVGDAVEVAYSVEGENPIFEGRLSSGMQLAYDTPVDLMHHRFTVPAGRAVTARPLASDIQPERFTEGGHTVLRVVRQQVPALPQEPGTPPWVKVFPAIDISGYADWAEVDAWAQRLFALPQPTPAEVLQQAQALRAGGLAGEALASEVLRFVQDEVRYFSVSLGESSHRPKPPQQTLAERLGDCKDKTVLLVAMLRELGFDARPALVSMQRNRGLPNYLPAHDVFDHVITRLELGGKTWWLDATINGQGLTLASRGQLPYGSALVVGGGGQLQAVAEGPAALHRLEFEQRWDLLHLDRPARLHTTMRAHGWLAERWRNAVATAGAEQVGKNLAGGYARLVPGLQPSGPAQVQDDRRANVFEFSQRFEVAELGQYMRGHLEVEFNALELLDVLTGPAEAQRRLPYLVDQPRLVDSRIVITAPGPFYFTPPPATEVVDPQFRFTARLERQASSAIYSRRYERREDEVPPARLAAWREKVLRARAATGGRLRLPLLDLQALMPEMDQLERRVRSGRAWKNDALGSMLVRYEIDRVLDGRVLQKAGPGSALALRAQASRAMSNNQLGEHGLGLADADAVLAVQPQNAEALEARALAPLGLGRAEEALASLQRLPAAGRSDFITAWMGILQLHLGRAPEAEALLREAAANGSGEGREFALLWLYLAAERQGGRGQAAIADHVDGSDPQRISGALLRHMAGRLDREALLRQASAKPEMERLNLAEAAFFIGQRLLLQGKRDEARYWFQRAVDTQATPFREVTLARLELAR